MEYPVGFDQATYRKKPICGVLAMAMVCEVSWQVAHAACRQAMIDVNPHRKRFGGITNLEQLELVMSRQAVKFQKHDMTGKRILRLHDFVCYYSKPDITYLVRTPGHIMTVRNHCVVDQARSCNFLLRKNTKVTHWYEITGKGW